MVYWYIQVYQSPGKVNPPLIVSSKKTVLKKLKYKSINQWDSVGHMNLMGVLEKNFKIEMDMNDIVDFSSFEKGKKILKKYKIKF